MSNEEKRDKLDEPDFGSGGDDVEAHKHDVGKHDVGATDDEPEGDDVEAHKHDVGKHDVG